MARPQCDTHLVMIVTEVALHLMALPAVVVYGMCSTKLSMIKLERIAI
jgi:hypothetical protein